MDLSRAKTILIACFLALNLFLAYRLWYSPSYWRAGSVLPSVEVEHAREALASAGIELLTSIPRQVPRLPLLYVERFAADPISWQARIWGEEVVGARVAGTGNMLYAWQNEQLEMAQNGLVIIRSFQGGETGTIVGEDGRMMVERFLRERGLWWDDLKFDIAYAGEQGTYHYRYLQTFQGFPLFSGFVDVRVRDGAVAEARIHRVIPLGFGNREIQVISAAEAALALIEHPPGLPGDKRIVDISLGYYSQAYDAARWEIPPVWRIAAADGHVFYINAFTGETEPLM